ncbi:MAG: ABC transporter permease [Lachnospiraceae bacterium]|nr:ABC transporter permease [Lachnospiraceae bacterium]MCR5428632.1 ABC transporter permease [Lachnospiraceae bacterium]
MTELLTLFHSAVVFGTVIMFGALGEILTEKSGNLNLGVPGIMYLGGIAGLTASFVYETGNPNPNGLLSAFLALVFSFLFAALGGLLYSFLTISLRTNQNVTGLTLTIFGGGVANFLGGMLQKFAGGVGQVSVSAASGTFRAYISAIAGKDTSSPLYAIFGYGWLTYVAIIIAIGLFIFLNKTRTGLNLRAVGENPATADAAGINVTLYKYLGTCIGAGISGLGGLYYTMDFIKGTWANDGTIEALGWLAVALVIFATWRPVNAIWGAYLFGIAYWAYLYIRGLNRYTMELFKMLPYVITLFVLILVSLRRKKEDQPPEHLGLPYFREER